MPNLPAGAPTPVTYRVSSTARGNAKWRPIALCVPALVVVLIAYGRLSSGTRMHQDEPAWIGSAYYFELLVRGEWTHPDWRLMTARENPFVGKLLFGIAFRATGCPVQSFQPLAGWNEVWHLKFEKSWGAGQARAERLAVSQRLTPEARLAIQEERFRFVEPKQLVSARLVVAGFGVVCAMAITALGQKTRGAMTGIAAGLMLAMNPLAVESYTHALFDIIALAFTSLTMLALIALLRPLAEESGDQWRPVAMSLVAGALLALSVGTKMNALIAVLVAIEFILILVLRWIVRRDLQALRIAFLLGTSLAIGFVMFIALNPPLYGDVLGGIRDLFAISARTTRVQAGFLPDYLGTPLAKLRAVGSLLCGHPAGLLILIPATLWPTWVGLRRFSPRTIVVLWWWTSLAAVTAWIPFPWPRYVLPLLAPAALLVADLLVGLAIQVNRVLVIVPGQRHDKSKWNSRFDHQVHARADD